MKKSLPLPSAAEKRFFALRRAVLTALRSYERRIISAIRVEPWSFRLHPVFGMESFFCFIILIIKKNGGILMIKVTLKDGSFKEFEKGVTVMDVAKSLGAGLYKAACLGKVNGEIGRASCRERV